MEMMVRETWTDERLDDLTKHMDRGFDRVDARFGCVEGSIRELHAEVDKRFDKVDDRFDRVASASTGWMAASNEWMLDSTRSSGRWPWARSR